LCKGSGGGGGKASPSRLGGKRGVGVVENRWGVDEQKTEKWGGVGVKKKKKKTPFPCDQNNPKKKPQVPVKKDRGGAQKKGGGVETPHLAKKQGPKGVKTLNKIQQKTTQGGEKNKPMGQWPTMWGGGVGTPVFVLPGSKKKKKTTMESTLGGGEGGCVFVAPGGGGNSLRKVTGKTKNNGVKE